MKHLVAGGSTCREQGLGKDLSFATVAVEISGGCGVFAVTVNPHIGNSVGIMRRAITGSKGEITDSVGGVRIRAIGLVILRAPSGGRDTFEAAIVGEIALVKHLLRHYVGRVRRY